MRTPEEFTFEIPNHLGAYKHRPVRIVHNGEDITDRVSSYQIHAGERNEVTRVTITYALCNVNLPERGRHERVS